MSRKEARASAGSDRLLDWLATTRVVGKRKGEKIMFIPLSLEVPSFFTLFSDRPLRHLFPSHRSNVFEFVLELDVRRSSIIVPFSSRKYKTLCSGLRRTNKMLKFYPKVCRT